MLQWDTCLPVDHRVGCCSTCTDIHTSTAVAAFCICAPQSYILANAAVSRSFSAYFAALIGKPTNFFTFPYQDYTVDFLAAGLMVACGLLLMFTTAGGLQHPPPPPIHPPRCWGWATPLHTHFHVAGLCIPSLCQQHYSETLALIWWCAC